MATVTATSSSNLQVRITDGRHVIIGDEPASAGGDDQGFDPYSLLLASLGACTVMTLQLYAKQKKWDLREVTVHLSHDKIYAEDCSTCETKEGKIDRIQRRILLHGNLDDSQKERLREIAKRCPVHRTLTSEITIEDS
jgi:Predicted redox protein, regulator of disulfide bond formation